MSSSTLLYKKADPAKLASGYTLKKGVVEPVANAFSPARKAGVAAMRLGREIHEHGSSHREDRQWQHRDSTIMIPSFT
jgi:hypothetical protein